MSLCIACHQKIELCECVWSAVRKLQSNISQCIDVKMMQTEIQRNEEWQTVFRKLIDDLFDYFHNINERVMFIEKVRIEPIAVTKEYADKVIKGSDELQEHANAAFWYNQANQLKTKVQHMEMQLGKEKADYKHLLSIFDDLKQNYEILKSNHSRLIAASPRNERLVREWEREESNNHNGGCCL